MPGAAVTTAKETAGDVPPAAFIELPPLEGDADPPELGPAPPIADRPPATTDATPDGAPPALVGPCIAPPDEEKDPPEDVAPFAPGTAIEGGCRTSPEQPESTMEQASVDMKRIRSTFAATGGIV